MKYTCIILNIYVFKPFLFSPYLVLLRKGFQTCSPLLNLSRSLFSAVGKSNMLLDINIMHLAHTFIQTNSRSIQGIHNLFATWQINPHLLLNISSKSSEGLQEGFVLRLYGRTSLNVFKGHVQFAKLFQCLTSSEQSFDICCVHVDRCSW